MQIKISTKKKASIFFERDIEKKGKGE